MSVETRVGPARELDVRGLDGTGEVVAYHDGGLFPVLALAQDGTVVAALRGGAGHLGLAGRIETIRSRDAGATWTPPSIIADSDRDDRNPAFGRAASGALILAYQRQSSYDAEGVYRPDLRLESGARPIELMLTRSVDGGLTWDEPAPLGVAALSAGSPFGKIVEMDGTLLMAIYAHADDDGVDSHLVRSIDGGATWGDASLVARRMNETALLPVGDGALLAVMRSADSAQALFGARSLDGGRTWSEPRPITTANQHPADLVELGSGDLLLTYGNRAPPHRIEGLLSSDRGASWSDVLLCFSGALHGYAAASRRRTDLGYPSTVIARSPGQAARGVTLYYHQPSIGDGGPTYLSTGYRAVAISWREDALVEAAARLRRSPRRAPG